MSRVLLFANLLLKTKRQHFKFSKSLFDILQKSENWMKNDVYEFEEKKKKNCWLQHTQTRRRFHFNWNAVVRIVRITQFDI